MATSRMNPIQPIPRTVANLTLWLDAADTSSITLSGTSVTAVADKSSVKNNYVQNTAGNRPTYQVDPVYNQPGFLFTRGSGTNLTPANNALRSVNSSSWTIFFVCRFSDANQTSVQTIWRGQLQGYWTRFYIPGNASFNIPGSDVQFGRTFANASGVWGSVVSTSAQTIFLNGTQTGTGGRGNVSMSDYFTIGGNGSGEGMTGYIFEFLVYDTTALSTTDRQLIEGYLAWKWGLQANLPSNHPYARLNPGAPIYPIQYSLPTSTRKGNLFLLPTQISNCRMWLDSADASTFNLSGTNILTWRDKSGNTNNAVVSGTAYATYSTNPLGVYFNNSLYLTPYTADPTNETVFLLFNFTGGSSQMIMIGAYSGGRSISIYNDLATMGIIKAQIGWGPTVAYTRNILQLATAVITAGSSQTISINAGNPSTGGAVTYNSGNVTILGREAGIQLGYVGYIQEIVIYNRVLTTTEQNQMQGYLAWKWGFQKNLPSNHPFRNGPPSPFPQVTLPQIMRAAFRPTATRFTYTGAAQTYTVPANTSLIYVYLWGAGGGRSATDGGAGAFVSGTVNVSPGATYSIVVGKSGNTNGTVRGTMAQGGGGSGSYSYLGGGGFSGIFSGASLVIGALVAIAGGGGTASFFGPRGGSGGVIQGGTGTSPGGGYPGTGGTQTAGGTTLPGTFTTTYGEQFFGGAGRIEGPGGGGGYYGGGGSDCRFQPGQLYAGSGGGSSFTGGFASILSTADGVAPNGSITTQPGGITNTYYVSPFGQALQNGYAVIVTLAP